MIRVFIIFLHFSLDKYDTYLFLKIFYYFIRYSQQIKLKHMVIYYKTCKDIINIPSLNIRIIYLILIRILTLPNNKHLISSCTCLLKCNML